MWDTRRNGPDPSTSASNHGSERYLQRGTFAQYQDPYFLSLPFRTVPSPCHAIIADPPCLYVSQYRYRQSRRCGTYSTRVPASLQHVSGTSTCLVHLAEWTLSIFGPSDEGTRHLARPGSAAEVPAGQASIIPTIPSAPQASTTRV